MFVCLCVRSVAWRGLNTRCLAKLAHTNLLFRPSLAARPRRHGLGGREADVERALAREEACVLRREDPGGLVALVVVRLRGQKGVGWAESEQLTAGGGREPLCAGGTLREYARATSRAAL